MTKNQLVENLIKQDVLKKLRILEAFLKINRADFVLPEYREFAYEDHPLPIGYGQTISQPYTVAFMLDLLDVKAGEKVLDVGSGSGWTVALLSSIVGKKGRVAGIERIPQLVEFAKSNLSKYPVLQRTSTVMEGDGTGGYKQESPYDRILVSASANEIPKALIKQLKIGGRLVVPIKDSIEVLDKISKDECQKKEYWGFAFVPLIKS